MKPYAEFNEWNVVKVYRLEWQSGKQVMNYPHTQEMIEDITSKLRVTSIARIRFDSVATS